MADRYTYFPSIGLFLLTAWAAADLVDYRRIPWQTAGAAAACLLAACAYHTYVQTGYWRDAKTLWRHALAVKEDNALAQFNYGLALDRDGHLDDAVRHYDRALAIDPNYFEARYNLALARLRQQKWDDAIRNFELVLKQRPDHFAAHNNCGSVLLQLGKVTEACEHFRAALAIDPEQALTHLNLGSGLERQGDFEGAAAEYSRALEIAADAPGGFAPGDPKRGMAHFQRGRLFLLLGKLENAEADFRSAAELRPGDAESFANLGLVYALERKPRQALAPFRAALDRQPAGRYFLDLAHALQQTGETALARRCYQEGLKRDPQWPEQLNQGAWRLATDRSSWAGHGPLSELLARQLCEATDYQNPDYVDTLAAALARNGRYDEARSMAKKALDLLPARGNAAWKTPIQARLRAYESNERYRAPTESARKWD